MGDAPENKENLKQGSNSASVVSIPVGFFIATELAFIFSILIALKYGIGFDEQFDEGTWFVLGGFTLWFPTSFLILPIMVVIRMYAIINLKRLTISTSGNSADLTDALKFTEKNYLFQKTKSVEIKRKDITLVKIKRETWGIKYVWVILLSAHLIYMLTDGITLLTNPFLFGDGVGNALAYTFSGVLDLVIIAFLIFTPQTRIEVHTGGNIYKFEYYYRAKNQKIFNEFEKICGIAPENAENLWEDVKLHQRKKGPSTELIMGVVFISIGVISKIFHIFAGGPLRFVLYLGGIVFLLYSIIYQLPLSSFPKSIALMSNTTDHLLIYRNSRVISRTSYLIRNFDGDSLKVGLHSNMLDTVRYSALLIIPFLTGWTMGAWFRFLPANPIYSYFPVISAANILFSLVILGMLAVVATNIYETYLPTRKWECDRIQMPHIFLKEHEGLEKANIKGKFLIYKENMTKKMKKQLIFRISAIVGLSVLGYISAYIF